MKKRYGLLVFVMLSFTILSLYGLQHFHHEKINTTQNLDSGSKNKPIKSGKITKVPWENNEEFLTMQKENDFVQIAAFRTVLSNPLPGEANNVRIATQLLSGTIVQPGQVFSQNRTIGPYTVEKGFQNGIVYLGTHLTTMTGGGVCKIATTLYNVTVLCDLPVIERHNHSMPVNYVPYGQDATVSYGNKDFRFLNNTSSPILIWAENIDNIIYMGFYGKKMPPEVKWCHKTLKKMKTYTIYRSNNQLAEGTEKVISEGMDGAIVKSWLEINDNSEKPKIKEMGKSYYSPLPRIIEKGPGTPAAKTTLYLNRIFNYFSN